MKTDAYTRIVLTVLASTLIVFVIHVFGSEAVYGQRPDNNYCRDPRDPRCPRPSPRPSVWDSSPRRPSYRPSMNPLPFEGDWRCDEKRGVRLLRGGGTCPRPRPKMKP